MAVWGGRWAGSLAGRWGGRLDPPAYLPTLADCSGRSGPGCTWRHERRLMTVASHSYPRGAGGRDGEDRVLLAAAAHLTDRDRYLVRLVGEHRVLTTGQLCAVGFGSIVTTRHRLAVLVGIGVLRRFRPHLPSGSAPWHYLLGPVGAALLGAEDRDERKWLPQVRADRQLALERSQRLAHMTGRNGFFVALTAHERTGGGQLVEWLNETEAARRYPAQIYAGSVNVGQLPNPDGLGTWAQDGREVTFLLEYDTGTENLARLAGKLDGYAVLARALAQAGEACPPLLWCLPGPRREQSARRALAGTGHAAGLRIATAAIDPAVTSPAGQVWMPLGTTLGQVRLIDVAAAIPDPWQAYRDDQARQHREAVRAAEAERARLLDEDWDSQPAGQDFTY